jgi:hypothetical protein
MLNRNHIAADANFRQNNKARGQQIVDAPLGPGYAYMINPAVVKDVVQNVVYDETSEVVRCV